MWPFDDPVKKEAELRRISREKRRRTLQFWKGSEPAIYKPTWGDTVASWIPTLMMGALGYLIYLVMKKIQNEKKPPSRRRKKPLQVELKQKKKPLQGEPKKKKKVLISVPQTAKSTARKASTETPPSLSQARKDEICRPSVSTPQSSTKQPAVEIQKYRRAAIKRAVNKPVGIPSLEPSQTSAESDVPKEADTKRVHKVKDKRSRSRSRSPSDCRGRRASGSARDAPLSRSRIPVRGKSPPRSNGATPNAASPSQVETPGAYRSFETAIVDNNGDSYGNNLPSNGEQSPEKDGEKEPQKRRSRAGRRSSMPFIRTTSNGDDAMLDESAANRRSMSLERKLIVDPNEEAPMIMFPQPKKKPEPENEGELRDFGVIRKALRKRRCSLTRSSIAGGGVGAGGSVMGMSVGSTQSLIQRELERLQGTINRRDSKKLTELADINSRRISFDQKSNGSNHLLTHLQLLRTRMMEIKNDSSVCESSLDMEAVYDGGSIGGSVVVSGDSRTRSSAGSLMDVFFDPSADTPPYLTIYYGTQSGTSEYYAYALQQEGQAMGLDVCICNVSHLVYSIEMSIDQEMNQILVPRVTGSGKKRGRAVFLMSTYQDGGPTDDAKGFLTTLQEIKDRKYLKGLRYAVFGFGNSTYDTYNSQAKLYDQLLSQLGGKRLVGLGLGDDSKDIDWDFEQWKWKKWWPTLADLASKDNQADPKAAELTPKDDGNPADGTNGGTAPPVNANDETALDFTVKFVTDEEVGMERLKWKFAPLHPTGKQFREGAQYAVRDIKPLWRDPDLSPMLKQSGSTMQIAIDAASPIGPGLEFKTGDSVAILPKNKASVVEALAAQLDFDLDQMFVLQPKPYLKEKDFRMPFPVPCTIRDLLTQYCELTAPPRRAVVRALSKCATDEEEQNELYRLSSKKHREEYMTRVVDQKLGLAHFISDYYVSVKMPLIKFIGLCSPMQPRWYSISSSMLSNPKQFTLTYAVVSIPRSLDNSYAQGTATHYLSGIPIGTRIRILRSMTSGLVPPINPSRPLILIANGSGIAPMRALIQERHHQKSELGFTVGPTELFFGIRRRDLDFLYNEEFKGYQQSGTLGALYLACSREQMHKIYVQHLLARHAEHVWKLIQRGAHVYVCGSTSMGSEVEHLLRAVISKRLEMGESVEDYMSEMTKSGRYVKELFDANHRR